MDKSLLLALDIGTSSIHAMVVQASGQPLSAVSRPLQTFAPEGGPALAREISPQTLLQDVSELVNAALGQAEARPVDIAAIGVTSQRQGVAFLDAQGRELYLGPNTDLRAILEGAAIDEELASEVYSVTGHLPSLMFAPARARWFKEHQPQVYSKTAHVLTVAGWLAYRLTGQVADEPSQAGESGLLDVTRWEHCQALLERLGVDSHWLPVLLAAGNPVGTLRAPAARTLGLPEGVPVTLAGPDTQCGVLAITSGQEGAIGILAGWSCTVQMVTSRPCWDTERRTWVGCLPVPGLWVVESNVGDAGNSYRWLVGLLADSREPYQEAERLAAQVPLGSDGAMAFLGPGPVSMARAGLRTGGLIFGTPLSFQEVSRGQLFRAFMENLAYGVKANLETVEAIAGERARAIRLGGGMSRSRTLAQVLADVLGREMAVSALPQASTLGAAMAAGVASGLYKDLKEAAQAMAPQLHVVEPDPVGAAEYQDLYERWLAMYHRLQEGG